MKTMTAYLSAPTLAQLFGAVSLKRLWTALSVQRERQRLSDLDDRTLEDIGLTRADVDIEAMRGFWDIPAGR
ncbi:MAG: DUF1127 domain-containing protein [Pseudomonadota bacterium]